MPYRAIARRVQDLGPTLVIGLCVLAAGGWAFGALAEEVAEGDTGLDNRIADELHEHATRPLTEFFEAVTTLGNGIVLQASPQSPHTFSRGGATTPKRC